MPAASPLPRAAAPTPQGVIRLTRFALAALAALAVTVVVSAPTSASTAAPKTGPAAAAAGGIGLRLVDAPLTARDDPRARVYIVDHLAPGTVIERRIEVSNTTAATAHVELYPAAATIKSGAFVGVADRGPNEVSTWTTVIPTALDIPTGGRAMVAVTITVPPDAAPGEQYGVLWAEARSAPPEGAGVTQVSRVGIRLYLSVGPGGAPAADFTIDALTAGRSPEGRPMVLAIVHNTGGRALDINGTLQLLAGPGGLSAGPFAATLGSTLAIGDTEPVTIALDKQVPAGPWEASITLRSGLVERSARATLTFPDTGASTTVDTTFTRPGWLHPAIAGLLILLTVGIADLLTAPRGRGRRRRTTNNPDPHDAREALTTP